MTAPLTKKFFDKNDVIFFPKTKAEAIFIQRCLIEMGMRWKESGKTLIDYPEQCVDYGMLVMKGVIYTLPTEGASTHFKGVICDVTALSPHFNASAAALERRVKELEAKVEQLLDAQGPAKPLKPIDLDIGKRKK